MPVDRLLQGLTEHVIRHTLFTRKDKLVVTVSGGIDSMVLLDLLHRLGHEWELELVVAHFNHCLRGAESDEDEAFVEREAHARGILFRTGRADIRSIATAGKHSLQETARDARYSFFAHVRSSLNFTTIVTAHHADDTAETILLNLCRGAGITGLAGIPLTRTDLPVARPLLFATRDMIDAYAQERRLPYREDSSNASTEYARNYLRHEIMPLLREHLNPNLTATLGRTGEIFRSLAGYLKEKTGELARDIILRRTPDELLLDRERLLAAPEFLQELVLFELARDFSGGEIEFVHTHNMLEIVRGGTGTYTTLTGESVFARDRDHLIFRHAPIAVPFHHRIELEKEYEFARFRFESHLVARASFSHNPNVEVVDGSRLGDNLVLRSWREGDSFVPLGMSDKKKLSDFFIDAKVPLFDKQTTPVLESKGEIVWICGLRLDNRYKVTPSTKTIVQLVYHPRS